MAAAAESRTLLVAPVADCEVKIQRILIANRGEIACRVVRTCKLLGIEAVAVYADEDAPSLHVTQADRAIRIGSVATASKNPYLDSTLLVKTALAVNADAIHPGYGYLSENADFADEVRAAGIIFMGPHRKALATLGDKRQAKDYLREHAPDVPLIPGFAGSSQDIEDLAHAADEIGYPVMVKASAGGGGKGLRVAHNAGELKNALERARSEAQRSFGSSDCILEKFVAAGKHVEIQIVGDAHGQVACFWDRECSVQRRNQKIIEESPCPWITQSVREKMKQAAVSIAELLRYEGAGTVEFIVDIKTSKFYFLEVNARLQVEHPITEEVTGFDLVALQIYVAGRGRLDRLAPIRDIKQEGHAIECRLCAEDPSKEFMPTNGTIFLWQPPQRADCSVRYESAICSGSEVSIYFDSMIAKVVVWAPSRETAIDKMTHVLRNVACVGLRTNQGFLQSCLRHPAFRNPAYTTSFIPDNLDQLKRTVFYGEEGEVVQTMQLLAAVFLEHLPCTSTPVRNKAFKGIRPGFRNQSNDPGSVKSRIVTIVDGPASLADVSPSIIVRKYEEPCSTRSLQPPFFINDLSSLSSAGEKQSAAKAPDRRLGVAGYNVLTNIMRNKEFETWQSYQYSHPVLTGQPGPAREFAPSMSPAHYTFCVDINGVRTAAEVMLFPPTSGLSPDSGSTHMMLHSPIIGAPIHVAVASLLSYFRHEAASIAPLALSGTSEGSEGIRAPMPCKVIAILKKDGEEVKKGEAVMVIESMKMETNIVGSADGVFRKDVQPGQAVSAGKLLCTIK